MTKQLKTISEENIYVTMKVDLKATQTFEI